MRAASIALPNSSRRILPVHRRPDRQRRAERVRVLGRQRRRGDEPAVRRLLDERIEEELRRTLEQWVEALQVAAIAGVFVAIPQRQRQPRAAGGPHTPLRSVDRSGRAPEIGVVMRHPTAGAVHLARRSRAGDREIRHHRRQWIHRLGQVGRERRPVVHLGVDVDGVLAAPRRRHALVPEALQVCRLRTRPRAGNQQVAAVLEVERGETGILPIGERTHALVGRRVLRRPELECHPVEQLPVIADVRGA